MKLNRNANVTTTNKSLDEPLFSAEQCDALFAAVLVHDDIYSDARLPDVIHLDYSQEQLTQCYRICRQLWKDGVDREDLLAIINKIYRHRALSAEDQLAFRYLRAKIKHLRFAYAAFDERHRYPRMFHWMTAIMGNLQDAFKNKQHVSANRIAILVRFFLARLPYFLINKEIDKFQPSTNESFRQYVLDEIKFIHLNLAKKAITSKEFHEVRKVISRLVALYDNLKILYPSPYHVSISQYLSTINGLMGAMHDELIIKKFKKTQDYYADEFEMPVEIRQRLVALTEKYKATF
ncbi:conserved hypothetical protein [Candidatus Nitrotoga sp. M5]|nr:conserved hypothetical protein [Candidatus Nitrotoga sp. M5]